MNSFVFGINKSINTNQPTKSDAPSSTKNPSMNTFSCQKSTEKQKFYRHCHWPNDISIQCLWQHFWSEYQRGAPESCQPHLRIFLPCSSRYKSSNPFGTPATLNLRTPWIGRILHQSIHTALSVLQMLCHIHKLYQRNDNNQLISHENFLSKGIHWHIPHTNIWRHAHTDTSQGHTPHSNTTIWIGSH